MERSIGNGECEGHVLIVEIGAAAKSRVLKGA